MTYRIALLLNIAANSYQQAFRKRTKDGAEAPFGGVAGHLRTGSAMERGSASVRPGRQEVLEHP